MAVPLVHTALSVLLGGIDHFVRLGLDALVLRYVLRLPAPCLRQAGQHQDQLDTRIASTIRMGPIVEANERVCGKTCSFIRTRRIISYSASLMGHRQGDGVDQNELPAHVLRIAYCCRCPALLLSIVDRQQTVGLFH